jgi:hypothetical protein
VESKCAWAGDACLGMLVWTPAWRVCFIGGMKYCNEMGMGEDVQLPISRLSYAGALTFQSATECIRDNLTQTFRP